MYIQLITTVYIQSYMSILYTSTITKYSISGWLISIFDLEIWLVFMYSQSLLCGIGFSLIFFIFFWHSNEISIRGLQNTELYTVWCSEISAVNPPPPFSERKREVKRRQSMLSLRIENFPFQRRAKKRERKKENAVIYIENNNKEFLSLCCCCLL
jgi:hypothetical protein